MALVKCPECEKEISNQTPTCPNCGAPVHQIALGNFFLTPLIKQIFLGGFLVFLFVFVPDKIDDDRYIHLVMQIIFFPIFYIINTKSIIGKILPVLFYIFILITTTDIGIEYIRSL
ncbi:MAG: zinc ribbon domain-containing protein [Campylobacterota bacterium]|nr:zinc ribbon domain-containing protein [Campylobacterota bacterium]